MFVIKGYIARIKDSSACFFFCLFAFLLISGLAGCYNPTTEAVIISAPPVAAERLAVRRYTAGVSIENRAIEYFVLGDGEDVIFILATIHGDEPAGTPLVRRLSEYLSGQLYLMHRRRVVLLPVANPDGMARNNRYNAHGVDLNRNFSTANRINRASFGYKALSEPEARIIAEIIEKYRPDRIVSIHQPYGCIDYDGPGGDLAKRMGQYCNLPVKKLGAYAGSLGSYAGVTLGIPIITLELPGSKELSGLDAQSLWNSYGKALIAAVIYPEHILE